MRNIYGMERLLSHIYPAMSITLNMIIQTDTHTHTRTQRKDREWFSINHNEDQSP